MVAKRRKWWGKIVWIVRYPTQQAHVLGPQRGVGYILHVDLDKNIFDNLA